MPELPEVETTRRGLLPLVGQVVQSVTIRHPRLRWPIPAHLPQTLQGLRLNGLRRRAKYLLCDFSGEAGAGILLLHLGMSGRIQLMDDAYPAEKHDHFDVAFASGQVLRLRDPRRFGAVLWLEGEEAAHPLLASLGPEPLEDGFHAKYLRQALVNKSLAIKNAIMDGHVVVGVGNIYASESLFRSRIHPETPANRLSLKQCEKLVADIKQTLNEALNAGGSSLRDFFGTNGLPGYFQQSYFVYARTDEPCLVCGRPIKTMRLGQRSTFFCAHCQKARVKS